MGFSADAVADLIAPPPKTATAKTESVDPSQPSFDDHLDAANDARADQAARDARTDQSAEPSQIAEPAANVETQAAHEQEAPPEDASGEPKPEPHVHAQVLVQLIAGAQTPSPPTTMAQTKPAAPVQAAQVTPVTASPEATIAAAETAPQQQTQPKKATARAVAKSDTAAATPSNAPQTQETPAVAPAQPAAQTPQTQSQLAEGAAAAVAPVDAAPTQTAPGHAAKTGTENTKGADTPLRPAPVSPRETDAGAEAGTKPTEAKATTAAAGKPGPAAPQTDVTPQFNAPAAAPTPAAPLASALESVTPIHSTPDQSGLRAAPAASQVAHEIVRRFNGGNTSFDIRLDPPDLGRVDIRLEVSRDHKVTATVSADNPQALAELTRHARDLEQTLQSAGLELADNGLSFDLRQGREGNRNAREDGAPSAGAATQDPISDQAIARPRLESWRGVRVDMMV